jgi:3D-(3,5/4)-trihydroxycyclohexane-1,2-dione acylhydrolase (decyclizing)
VIAIETDPDRATQEGGWWWDVAVPEVSPREKLRVARAQYEEGQKEQRP